MARLDNAPVRMAKANVDRWFTNTPLGPAFIPGNGKALPLDEEVARGIRAGAEKYLLRSYDGLQRRLTIHAAVLVAAVVAVQRVRSGMAPDLDRIFVGVSYCLYTLHGLLTLHDAWKCERSALHLRDAITHSLMDKAPLPPTLAGRQAVVEPNYRLLGGITFSMIGLFTLLKGVELPTFISPWLPAIGVGAIVGILVWVAGFAWFQRLGVFSAEDGLGG